MIDRHYSLNLKPARTLYVYAHADLAQKYSVGLREPGCAPRKKIIFSCPDDSFDKALIMALINIQNYISKLN
jgi:hypothetical protein